MIKNNINIIVCVDSKFGFAKNNTIPWKLSNDLKHFKKITTNTPSTNLKNVVIMGRKTWETIKTPLPDRINIVLSNTMNNTNNNTNNKSNGIIIHKSLQESLTYCNSISQTVNTIFIIGGKRVYQEALECKCNKLYITYIKKNYKCDRIFPTIPSNYQLTDITDHKTKKGLGYQFRTYTRTDKIHDEYQYLHLLNKILTEGKLRTDRTGVGVKSIFGCQMRFNLKKQFPLLTTKKMFWKGIAKELFWFLRGDTNAKKLQEEGVHIWDGNSTREYLDSIGLTHLKEGDCGPIYGFNFRHFGGEYKNCHTDYTGIGTDQVNYCLNLIRNNPTSRRILINLWNPSDLKKVSLPACHVLYQFYVSDGYLSCSLYQRSGDMGLGVPFNIASASLLTYLFAHVTNLKPGELVHTIGDAHIYTNHIPALQKQMKRIPKPFPQLIIKTNKSNKLSELSYQNISVLGYTSHSKLSMKMAV